MVDEYLFSYTVTLKFREKLQIMCNVCEKSFIEREVLGMSLAHNFSYQVCYI